MPRKWTKAQREAQSRKMTKHWAKLKANREQAQSIKKVVKEVEIRRGTYKPTLWDRVKSALRLS